ncbi:MAG: helix-turn-helix domain containing protein [Oscillibacter sp.]|nr:helix-turn-helix domain containing protein [Oscillibacter sp.]MDY5711585.1 helix-turn-helix domain-containing protein [Oscillospiraceae bacterium]
MPQPISSTLDRIHAAARDEFLAKGYQAASLRNIVKTAGVTTSAFYGYYDSKEALFAALVDEPYRHVLETYRTAVFGFEALRPEEQVTQMGQVGKTCMQELLVYMDARRPVFRLILQGAEGTPYAGLIDELVAMEVAATERYCEVLRSLGSAVPQIDPRLEHMLVTGMMNAYCEVILHDMPLADAQRYVEELGDFYTAGWLKIMGQRCSVIFYPAIRCD